MLFPLRNSLPPDDAAQSAIKHANRVVAALYASPYVITQSGSGFTWPKTDMELIMVDDDQTADPEGGIPLVFEICRADQHELDHFQISFPEAEITTSYNMSADVGTVLAIVGVTLTTWQIVERFIERRRESRSITLNLSGKKIPLSRVDSAVIHGLLVEKTSIKIEVSRDGAP